MVPNGRVEIILSDGGDAPTPWATPHPQGAELSSGEVAFDTSKTLRFDWRDRFGLAGSEPFTLAVTAIDDHSRFCISAHLMVRESSPNVCDGLAAALRAHGVPGQILTDNGKVFTGRFNKPVVEVLFDRVLRENGVKHRLTQPRSPTTTGKVERFHKTLRAEFIKGRTFVSLEAAQAELDAWVTHYNTERAHQGIRQGRTGLHGHLRGRRGCALGWWKDYVSARRRMEQNRVSQDQPPRWAASASSSRSATRRPARVMSPPIQFTEARPSPPSMAAPPR